MTSATTLDTTDMRIIHRVFRRELRLLPDLVRGAGGDAARAKLVQAHAEEILGFLHHHHSGEDELVWPKLRERVQLESELVDRMEAQHEAVAALIGSIEAALPAWATTGDAGAGESLAADLDALHAQLVAHLDEEETHVLPLVARTFSQPEWDELGKRGFAAVPKNRRLVTLGQILEDTTDDERDEFLSHVPAPARLAWKLVGRRQWQREVARIRVPGQRRPE